MRHEDWRTGTRNSDSESNSDSDSEVVVRMEQLRLKFGVFMAPFHRLGDNLGLALERNIRTIQWLDELRFDEA